MRAVLFKDGLLVLFSEHSSILLSEALLCAELLVDPIFELTAEQMAIGGSPRRAPSDGIVIRSKKLPRFVNNGALPRLAAPPST